MPTTAEPIRVGVLSEVRSSVSELPRSLPAAKSGALRTAGAVVSIVTARADEAALVFPEMSVAVAVGGVKVKVCCPGCARKLAGLKGDKKVAAVFASLGKGFSLQTTCPVSGKPIDPIYVVTFRKQKVWFCCPKCNKAFLANPEKYVARLPQLKTRKKK